jgi:hypothetical protein
MPKIEEITDLKESLARHGLPQDALLAVAMLANRMYPNEDLSEDFHKDLAEKNAREAAANPSITSRPGHHAKPKEVLYNEEHHLPNTQEQADAVARAAHSPSAVNTTVGAVPVVPGQGPEAIASSISNASRAPGVDVAGDNANAAKSDNPELPGENHLTQNPNNPALAADQPTNGQASDAAHLPGSPNDTAEKEKGQVDGAKGPSPTITK